jgi:hypothetical protein
VLGALPAPEDSMARFSAIVAYDPSSKKKLKGLKIELKNGNQADVVCLDEEGLKQFQDSLESQRGTQRFIEEHLERYTPSELEKPGTADAINQSPATGEWYTAFVVGSYRNENHFGVYLRAPGGTRHHTVQLWLPNASASQVVDLLTAGCTFLQAN